MDSSTAARRTPLWMFPQAHYAARDKYLRAGKSLAGHDDDELKALWSSTEYDTRSVPSGRFGKRRPPLRRSGARPTRRRQRDGPRRMQQYHTGTNRGKHEGGRDHARHRLQSGTSRRPPAALRRAPGVSDPLEGDRRLHVGRPGGRPGEDRSARGAARGGRGAAAAVTSRIMERARSLSQGVASDAGRRVAVGDKAGGAG